MKATAMDSRVQSGLCQAQLPCRPFVAYRQQRRNLLNRLSARAVTKNVTVPPLSPLDSSYEDKHYFSSYANWIIPDYVMLGRYPFVEPSRCTTREQGEKQLEAILEKGIITFVSLQAEVPPQEKMTIAGCRGFLAYKATAELIHASQIGPPPGEIINGLRNPSLDQFLPPRHKKNTSQYDEFAAIRKLQFVHFPIEDLGVPSEEGVKQLVQQLEGRVEAGEKLYVHCWGGRGRAGTVGACLLAKMYGVSAEEALERVKRAFSTRMDVLNTSPETQEQVEFVKRVVSGMAGARR